MIHQHPTLGAIVLSRAPVPTSAPPSFNGDNVLYTLNLFVFSAGFALCLMFFLKLAIDHWKCARAPADSHHHDDPRSPMQVLRRIGLLWTGAYALRCASEAQALWRWNPFDPVGSASAITLKRSLDPIAANVGYVALAVFFLSLPGLTEQLRKEPFPVDMWIAMPHLRRPAIVVALCLVAAVGVVATR